MLSQPVNQAFGLGHLNIRTHGARLTAMVSHGDDQTELPLLWRLCLEWIELGYPVTVLDATLQESQENPGLEQLLDYPYLPCLGTSEAIGWNVFPAASGIHALFSSHCTLERLRSILGRIFSDGVVVIYGKAEWLSPLLAGSGIQPVLVVSSAKQSLISSYVALKRILAAGDLQPIVVTESPQSTSHMPIALGEAGSSLVACAKSFLGYELKILPLSLARDDAPTPPDLRGLPLRMLERAHSLSTQWPYVTDQLATASRNH